MLQLWSIILMFVTDRSSGGAVTVMDPLTTIWDMELASGSDRNVPYRSRFEVPVAMVWKCIANM